MIELYEAIQITKPLKNSFILISVKRSPKIRPTPEVAAYLTGRVASPVVRPPLRPLDPEAVEALKSDLEAAGEEIVTLG